MRENREKRTELSRFAMLAKTARPAIFPENPRSFFQQTPRSIFAKTGRKIRREEEVGGKLPIAQRKKGV